MGYISILDNLDGKTSSVTPQPGFTPVQVLDSNGNLTTIWVKVG
jgi:hypothetical protein